MPEKLIYESKKSKIYLVDESEWEQPVIMKLLNYEFPTPLDISQFYNEFDIISGLNLPGIRNVLKRTKVKNRHGMLLEWVDSQTLAETFRNKQADIVDFLYIATAIAQAVSDIHHHNIIHKDINANNILVNLQKRVVKIIDFGISSKIDLKQPHLGNPERLEGTLSYISPEQTGRMNRVVDYRTDLYSMGITFYEMLTGLPPFVAKDAMELVHCHIAQTPKPVYVVNPNVPKPISDVIDRLLAKNAEDRYQSALGVKYDLELCLKQYQAKRSVAAFTLGLHDFSGKFQLPQKLYGRENELDALIDAFGRSASGNHEMILVAGYSGTGKSVLVREVHKPITQKLGYFIEGKFDQFQRSVPYFAIIQALREFVNILLTENEDKLSRLRTSIQSAIGAEGKVLTDVIPNLEHIIGPQPDVPEIGGTEAQNRFNYVFRKLITAIATEEHPVVLFIDDLQWADSASLSLLNVLLTNPEGCSLLCIGAYRDNEVSASHPFIITVGDMQAAGARISTIQLGNLSDSHVNQLIADAVGATDAQTTRDLTELVYAKTQGNAFFVTQFLMSLYQERLLTFDHDSKQWTWDLKQVKEQNITDNVVELMAGKILKLAPETQQVLKLAACIGNSFDLDTLAVIYGKDAADTSHDLYQSLSEGMIVPAGDKFRFSHDRIQQAVYSLIPDAEKNAVHLSIGRLLLSNIPADQQDDRLFDIVNQWNWGIDIITSPEDREQLARLNLRAGMKAKQTSAFKPASDYFETGINLLQADPWKNQYELCRDLHTEATEAAYLNGDFGQMDRLFRAVLDNVHDLIEKVKPYGIRILAYKAENKLIDAINTGLELLAQLGEKFPGKPVMAHVMLDLVKTKFLLRGKTNDRLQALPTMTDPYKIAAMRIMADIASSSYWATPTLFPLVIFRMVHLSLKYGNTSVSAFAFATYGVIMCGVLGDMKNGYEFGKLGLILLEKFNAKEWKTQIYTPIYALIVNWNEHVHNTLRPLQESYHIGMETGAIEFACINTNIYCIHAYLSGKRLVRLEEETKAYSQSFNQFKQETNFNYNEVYRQPMLNFMGKSANPLKLTGEAYDEDKMMAQNLDRNDKTGQFFIHFNKLILAYYFHDYEHAAQHAEASRKLLEAVLAKFEIPNHHFYEALTLLALYPKAGKAEQRKYMGRIRKNMRQMKKWASNAPENYRHKHQLMEAERLRVTGRSAEARLMYDTAIAGASQNDYVHEEALGYELAGRCYLDLKSEDLTEYYLKAAYNAYREWGAVAKLRDLEQTFPKYVSAVNRAASGGFNQNATVQTSTTGMHGAMLDISSVLKAAATISGNILLPNLLRTLMAIIIENAGARQGMLLLEKDGQLLIEAQMHNAGEETSILQSIPVENSGLLAETVVQYVRRTGQRVVINNAIADTRWEKDPYVVQHRPQSILCLPIFNQGKFIGMLYLENDLTAGAFTQDRTDLLSLLSGQIAVSIDNALLYDQMEQKVQDRTAELAAEKKKSDDLLYNILPVETADELKRSGRTLPRRYENVTVMFTDFKGFTMIAETLNPEELVSEVDACFGAFDEIIGRYGIEKIKTIGDAYMCVGGLPVPNSTHPEDVVRAALEIQRWIGQRGDERRAGGLPYFDIRIGLHTGPVVAGVVGSKKFAYDIWGDTVNTANRMESSGEPGRVNISGETYNLISNHFTCAFRGEISAKNKGKIKMYFVDSEID